MHSNIIICVRPYLKLKHLSQNTLRQIRQYSLYFPNTLIENGLPSHDSSIAFIWFESKLLEGYCNMKKTICVICDEIIVKTVNKLLYRHLPLKHQVSAIFSMCPKGALLPLYKQGVCCHMLPTPLPLTVQTLFKKDDSLLFCL